MTEDFYNPFYTAIELGDIKAVKTLLLEDADVNYLGFLLPTPLSLASRLGNNELVTLLIEEGADLNTDCLINAALYNQEDTVKLLLDHGAQANTSHFTLTHGTIAPLHAAAEAGNIRIAQLLLDQGAEVNQKGGYSKEATPLSYAAIMGKAGMVEFLLNQGAQLETYNPDALPPHESLNTSIANALVSSALFNAILSQDKDTFHILLERGVDQNLELSPVHIAVIEGNRENIQTLATYEDMNISDALGIKPIHYAAFLNDADSIHTLIEAGADFNTPLSLFQANDFVPLQIAMVQKATDAIDALYAHGAALSESLPFVLTELLNGYEESITLNETHPVNEPDPITYDPTLYPPLDPLSQIAASLPIDAF